MANSVTFPVEFGGNGKTYTDDANPNTGLDGTGYITRYVPTLQQAVVITGWTVQKAIEAKASAQTASAAANSAAADREQVATDRSQTILQRQLAATAAGDAQSAKLAAMNASRDAHDARDAVVIDKGLAAQARIDALTAAAGAGESEQGAGEYAATAEAARDAALANGAIFDDVAAGLASGQRFFTVPVAGGTEFLMLYRNDAGTATPLNAYPSQQMLVYGVEFSTANRLIMMFMQLEIRMDRLPTFNAPPAA